MSKNNQIIADRIARINASHMSPSHIARAYADYIDAKTQAIRAIASGVMAILADADNSDEILGDLRQMHIHEGTVIGVRDGGLVSYGQVITAINNARQQWTEDFIEHLPVVECATISTQAGQQSLTISDLIDDIGMSMAAADAYGLTLSAIAEGKETATDIVPYVRSQLQDRYIAISTAAPLLNRITEILKSNSSAAQKVYELASDIADSIADQDESNEAQLEYNYDSAITAMTGASPVSAFITDLTIDIDLSSVGTAIISGAKSVCNKVKSFFSRAKDVAVATANKITDYVGSKYTRPAVFIDAGNDTGSAFDIPLIDTEINSATYACYTGQDASALSPFAEVEYALGYGSWAEMAAELFNCTPLNRPQAIETDFMSARWWRTSGSASGESDYVFSSDHDGKPDAGYIESPLRAISTPVLDRDFRDPEVAFGSVPTAKAMIFSGFRRMHYELGAAPLFLQTSIKSFGADIFASGIGTTDWRIIEFRWLENSDWDVSHTVRVGFLNHEAKLNRSFQLFTLGVEAGKKYLIDANDEAYGEKIFIPEQHSGNAVLCPDNVKKTEVLIRVYYNPTTQDMSIYYRWKGKLRLWYKRSSWSHVSGHNAMLKRYDVGEERTEHPNDWIKNGALAENCGFAFVLCDPSGNFPRYEDEKSGHLTPTIADFNFRHEVYGGELLNFENEPAYSDALRCATIGSMRIEGDRLVPSVPSMRFQLFIKPVVPTTEWQETWATSSATSVFPNGTNATISQVLDLIFPDGEVNDSAFENEKQMYVGLAFSAKRAIVYLTLLGYAFGSVQDLDGSDYPRNPLSAAYREALRSAIGLGSEWSGGLLTINSSKPDMEDLNNVKVRNAWGYRVLSDGTGLFPLHDDELHQLSMPEHTGQGEYATAFCFLYPMLVRAIAWGGMNHVQPLIRLLGAGYDSIFIPYVDSPLFPPVRMRIASDSDSAAKFTTLVKHVYIAKLVIAAVVVTVITGVKVTRFLKVSSAQLSRLERQLGEANTPQEQDAILGEMKRLKRKRLIFNSFGNKVSVPTNPFAKTERDEQVDAIYVASNHSDNDYSEEMKAIQERLT